MGINVFSLLLLNKARRTFRVIKKNILTSIVIGVFLVLLLFSLFENGITIKIQIYQYIFIGALLYIISKLLQDFPTMILPYQSILYGVYNIHKIKLLIMLKSIALSLVLFFLLNLLSLEISSIERTRILILLLFNFCANLLCFIKTQIKNQNVFKAISILIISSGYYINNLLLAAAALFIVILAFLRIRFLRYENILPFYYSLGVISQGIFDKSAHLVREGQNTISIGNTESKLYLMEKYYEGIAKFEFSKEISRILYNYKKILNCSLINLVIGVVCAVYDYPPFMYSIALIVMLFLMDTILTSLNKEERNIKDSGFYLPFSLMQLIKAKYFSHLVIIFVPFLSSAFIFSRINIILYLIFIIVIPLKNIILNYSTKKAAKWFCYLIDSTIVGLLFL